MLRKNTAPKYGPGVLASRLEITYLEKVSNLTILRTTEEDEGMYHCAVLDWTENTWSGTYLSLRGNIKKTINYTIVQRSRTANTVNVEETETLECSILSGSQTKTCPGELQVFWFRARSSNSYPEIVFTSGVPQDVCMKKHDRKCVYSFSKNVSISETGTYYCALATCGEILFGDGTTLGVDQSLNSSFITLVTLKICLIISVILHITIACYLSIKKAKKQIKGKKSSHGHDVGQKEDHIDEDRNDLDYAALQFPGSKATIRCIKKNMDESVYSQVK
ncbi:PREDICTED: uncharacterized protein LOC107087735 isoform X2 [Cyprinodon variegatus]|uniref:uncharacterized protein LOC107087735 isoform X2 n=2 Tax=Cyprinodon variegatus TaxID=28743 RepID=UPI0007429E26|nr:PREDICTED: uncharacterized protein LOC107087735 isoform X2 [Cyprinodon variegatus]